MLRNIKRSVPSIILIIIALLFIWPMLWLIFASFDLQAPLTVRIPETFTLKHYEAILENPRNHRAFANSAIISFTQATAVVILSIFAAYPLSRLKMRNKAKIMYAILFLTGLPIMAIMVPVFVAFFELGIINSLTSTTLFLIATALPFSIWIMKTFMDDVPVELEEAAWVDGASSFQMISMVIVPLVIPGMFVVFILAFAGSWGNFFVPFMLLSSVDKLPASVIIFQFFGAHGRIVIGQLAAFSALYTFPIAVIYILAQRFMSEGFSLAGAIKK